MDEKVMEFADLLGESALKKLKKSGAGPGGSTSQEPAKNPVAPKPSKPSGDSDHSDSETEDSVSRSGRSSKGSSRSWRSKICVWGILSLFFAGGLFGTVVQVFHYLSGMNLFPYKELPSSEAEVKEVFNSGEAYVIYCATGSSRYVPAVLLDAARSFPRHVNTVMFDCTKPLSSNVAGELPMSIKDKLKLDDGKLPVLVVSNFGAPTQLSRSEFYSVDAIVAAVTRHTAPSFKEWKTQEDIAGKCFKKRRCLALVIDEPDLKEPKEPKSSSKKKSDKSKGIYDEQRKANKQSKESIVKALQTTAKDYLTVRVGYVTNSVPIQRSPDSGRVQWAKELKPAVSEEASQNLGLGLRVVCSFGDKAWTALVTQESEVAQYAKQCASGSKPGVQLSGVPLFIKP